MTVLLFQPHFEEPILSGRKMRTIRPRRKRPVRTGEDLSLRVWTGAAYRSKQREFARATCEGCLEVRITEFGVQLGTGPLETNLRKLNAFAKADGVASWQAMREFFSGRFNGYALPFEGTMILFTLGRGSSSRRCNDVAADQEEGRADCDR